MGITYVGLDIYSDKVINDIIDNKLCDGVILGDLFCENRMFQYGNNDLIRYFEEISRSDLDIVYQTPYYLTSRNDRQIYNNLRYLYNLKPESVILVSDVGFAAQIKKEFPEFKLVWSHMHRSRVDDKNDYTYSFLKQLGVDYVETADACKVEAIEANKLGVWMVFGNVKYKTFGRKCYLQEQIGEVLPNCRKLCIDSPYSLKAQESNYCMTIDGYILGKTLDYTSNTFKKNDTVCIYAYSYKDLVKRMGEIKYEEI